MKKKFLSMILMLVMITGLVGIIPAEAKAASASVSLGYASDYSSQWFTINNNSGETIYYDLNGESKGTMVYNQPVTQSTIAIDLNDYYWIDLYDADGNFLAEAVSLAEHPYSVIYQDESGRVLDGGESGTLIIGDRFNVYPDDVALDASGNEYVPVDANAKQVHFGQSNYTFTYREYTPDDITAYVDFVDLRGNILETKEISISYKNGAAFNDIPETLTYDGVKYTKEPGEPSSLRWNYYSPQLDYQIRYRAEEEPQQGPYSVPVYFEDAGDGTILGSDYITVSEENGGSYICPKTMVIRNDVTESYYELAKGEKETIAHEYDNNTASYTVKYKKFDEKTAYDWSVRLIDAASGKLLESTDIQVNVDETVTYEVDTEISVAGKNYILDSGMKKSYDHRYGTGSRIQYIYYNEEGTNVPGSYNLDIQYKSVSDDTILYTAQAEVTPTAAATFSVPENYNVNEKEYVLLAGQDKNITHDYYTPQKTYTMYYRDVNDLQNVDTVVTQEDVITSEVFTEGEAPAQTATVLTNPTTGTIVTLNDEGVPLADAPAGAEDDQNLTTAEDEEVPLAKGLDDKEGKDKGILAAAQNHPLTTGLILAALMAVLGCAGFFFRKKKSQKEEASDTTES